MGACFSFFEPPTLSLTPQGAGKTTLVTHLLASPHGLRLAVVLNEAASDAGIEDALVASAAAAAGATAVSGDEWIKLANGCLCCSVKSDFLSALETLATRDDGTDLDAILVETSGLADPGPAAASLWTDTALHAAARLDGVVAVVDSVRFRTALVDPRTDGAVREVALQVAYADVVVVNKIDAAGEAETNATETTIRSLNATATLIQATRSRVDPACLLGLRTVDADTAAAAAAAAATAAAAAATLGAPPPSTTAHAHDAGIATHAWTGPAGVVDEARLRAWLEGVLWGGREPPAMDLYRLKAVLPLALPTGTRRAVVQAVADTYEVVDCGAWEERGAGGDDDTTTATTAARAVAIGRFLDVGALEGGLAGAVVIEGG